MTITKRIYELLQALYNGIPERESCIQLGFLASIVNEPFYLFGRSGSGKSLIAKRIAAAFKAPKILKMSRRQQVFPNKLNAFDFIIFKDLNPQDETAKENVHIALHDREDATLIITGEQRPESVLSRAEITDKITLTITLPESLSPNALCDLLQNHSKIEEAHIPLGLAISSEEVKLWLNDIKKVSLSQDTLAIIGKLAEICDQNNTYVPIRKWIAYTNMIKAIAFFNGRTETRFTDTFFLGTPIWGRSTSNTAITNNFNNIVMSVLFKDIPEIVEKPYNAEELNTKVKTLLHSSNNLYDTKMFNNEPCLSYRITIAGEPTPLYAPLRYMETDQDFHPFNELKQVETHVRCNFHGTSSCTISIDASVKGVGLRNSMSRNNTNQNAKFEDFATLPSYILRENDPEVAAEKQKKLDECQAEAKNQMDIQAKYLYTLRDLYQANKAFRDDLFCNTAIFDKIQTDVRSIFDNNNAIANKIKETLELFKA